MNEKTWRQLRLLTAGLALVLMAAPATLRAQDAPRRGQGQGQGDGQGRRGRGGPGGPGGIARMSPVQTVERSKEDVMALDLKPEQKTKLDAIFKDASEQAKSLETEVASLQGRDRMEKIQPFNRDLREKVAGVLTDEQKQALRKKVAGRAAEQMTDRWKQALGQLNLTSEQQTKVDAILADARKNAEQQAAQSPPPDAGQGQGGGRGGALFASMRETRQKIEEVLTADQKQKLQELMPPGGRGGQGGRGRGGNNPPQQ